MALTSAATTTSECFLCSQQIPGNKTETGSGAPSSPGRDRDPANNPEFSEETAAPLVVLLCHILEIPDARIRGQFQQHAGAAVLCSSCLANIRDIQAMLEQVAELEKTVLERKAQVEDKLRESCAEKSARVQGAGISTKEAPRAAAAAANSVDQFRRQIVFELKSTKLLSTLTKIQEGRTGRRYFSSRNSEPQLQSPSGVSGSGTGNEREPEPEAPILSDFDDHSHNLSHNNHERIPTVDSHSQSQHTSTSAGYENQSTADDDDEVRVKAEHDIDVDIEPDPADTFGYTVQMDDPDPDRDPESQQFQGSESEDYDRELPGDPFGPSPHAHGKVKIKEEQECDVGVGIGTHRNIRILDTRLPPSRSGSGNNFSFENFDQDAAVALTLTKNPYLVEESEPINSLPLATATGPFSIDRHPGPIPIIWGSSSQFPIPKLPGQGYLGRCDDPGPGPGQGPTPSKSRSWSRSRARPRRRESPPTMPEDFHSSQSQNTRLRSTVHAHFSFIAMEHKYKCRYCSTRITKEQKSGTGNLKKHLNRFHKDKL